MIIVITATIVQKYQEQQQKQKQKNRISVDSNIIHVMLMFSLCLTYSIYPDTYKQDMNAVRCDAVCSHWTLYVKIFANSPALQH